MRANRKPDLLDYACDREVLVYTMGILFALGCLGMVLIWR